MPCTVQPRNALDTTALCSLFVLFTWSCCPTSQWSVIGCTVQPRTLPVYTSWHADQGPMSAFQNA